MNAQLADLDLVVLEFRDPIRVGSTDRDRGFAAMAAIEAAVSRLESEFQSTPLARKAIISSALREIYPLWTDAALRMYAHAGPYTAIRTRVEEGLRNIAAMDIYAE